MIETVRKTPNGLHVTYDDGQNVHVAELRECPWCGGSTDQILEEIADCITACCNLAAALGCDYMRPHLQEAERRNIKRGRYE